MKSTLSLLPRSKPICVALSGLVVLSSLAQAHDRPSTADSLSGFQEVPAPPQIAQDWVLAAATTREATGHSLASTPVSAPAPAPETNPVSVPAASHSTHGTVTASLTLAAPTQDMRQQLSELVQKALSRSPAVREAQANVQAAQGDVRQSEAGLWPRLEVGANSSAVTAQSATGNLHGGAAATLSYNVFDFGRVRSQIQSKEALLQSNQGKLAQAQEDVGFEAANAWLQWTRLQNMRAIHQQYVQDMQQLVERIQEIVWVFPGRRSELVQAQARYSQAADALSALRSRISEVQLVLLKLTGQKWSNQALTLAPSLPFPGVDQLVDHAKSLHPTVIAARQEAVAARAQAEEARASLKPETDLQWVKQTGQDANGLSTPSRLFLAAKWVAFDGFAGRANMEALEAKAQAAEERAEQVALDAEFKIRQSHAEADIQGARAQDMVRLLEQTDQVRQDSFEQWKFLGRRSLLDVLTAESEHFNAKMNQVNSVFDRQQAKARMLHEAAAFMPWLQGQLNWPQEPGVQAAPVATRPTPVLRQPLDPVASPLPAEMKERSAAPGWVESGVGR